MPERLGVYATLFGMLAIRVPLRNTNDHAAWRQRPDGTWRFVAQTGRQAKPFQVALSEISGCRHFQTAAGQAAYFCRDTCRQLLMI
jgi:hypothetical protein